MTLRTIIGTAAVLAAGALPGTAGAHVQVRPAQAAPGDAVLFTVVVPNEGDSDTTEVALKIPKGVLPFSFEDVPGFKRETETASDGSLDVVRWTGKLPPEGFARFAFLAGTPETEGPIAWKATQTYADGTVVRWIGAPDADEPAAVTEISSTVPRENAGGENDGGAEPAAAGASASPAAAASAKSEESDNKDERDPLALGLGAGGLVLGALAMGVALTRRRSALR